jgi:hypothetical protein
MALQWDVQLQIWRWKSEVWVITTVQSLLLLEVPLLWIRRLELSKSRLISKQNLKLPVTRSVPLHVTEARRYCLFLSRIQTVTTWRQPQTACAFTGYSAFSFECLRANSTAVYGNTAKPGYNGIHFDLNIFLSQAVSSQHRYIRITQ